MIKTSLQKGNFIHIDFVIDELITYNGFKDINIKQEFNLVNTKVDLGFYNIISTVDTTISLLYFNIWPVPNNIIESMNFIGGDIFTNFKQIEENLYEKHEDLTRYYETGFDLISSRIKRLGQPTEPDCKIRVKMIWRLV